jgi:FkbM family methyltransferase
MYYSYFQSAIEMISTHQQANPQDPEIPGLVDMLRKKINMSNAAAQEPVDQRFFGMMERIESRSEDEIFEMLLENFNAASEEYKRDVAWYCGEFLTHGFGRLEPENGVYDDFHIRAKMLKAHHADFMWLHQRLADARSKNVLFAVLSSWINTEQNTTIMYKECVSPAYFDPVFQRTDNEVFVDLGASGGDSVMHFSNAHLGNYKHAYCYEITPETFQDLKRNLHVNELAKSKITLNQKAAWSKPGTMRLSLGTGPAANQVKEYGGIEIETVRIDDDIPEPATFIKMDIEGAELEALKGCRRQIIENRPKLAICTYHGYNDIYAVPRLIDEIAPGVYELYMRYHGNEFYKMPTDFTLLGVPK